MIKHTLKTTLLTLLAASSALVAEPTKPAARLPETTTTGFSSVLSEETPIGVTGRPEWTSARRFTSTRVYIQKEPWEIGVESWWRIKNKRDGSIAHRLLEEVEIGLPYRMQLDLYTQIEGDQDGDFHYQSFDVELRWALADWGKIWGNPTLYAEYKFADPDWGPDVYELKLLLGGQIAPRWHWGVNFVWEAETGGEREHEFQIAGGLSFTLIDGRLGIGIEALYDRTTVKGGRGDDENQFNIGPSIQWRVTRNFHIDISCLFGTNDESTRQTGFLILGYDFGPGGHAERAYTPHSGMRN
jgi:Putative MetA-pathway of phenol degradation